MAPTPAHLVQIDVRGAAALVTVTRTFLGAATAGTAREDVLDLALPPAARLIDVEVDTSGKFEVLARAPSERARDGYLEATRAMGLGARAVSYDDDTTTRIRIASKQQRPNRVTTLRYRFSTLLQVAGRRAEIAFPPSPESSPVAARVIVRADAGQDVADISIAGAPHPLARGAPVTATEPVVSTAHRWIVSLGLGREQASPAHAAPSRVTALAARAPVARVGSGAATRIACAVGLTPAPPQPLPERVLFLVDRSRSVGAGGLELERETAQRILTALPPSTEFNALFFDRTQTRLFPVARTATRQALAALEDEMVPVRLQNGTDLAGALRATGELLRRDATAFAPRALIVILTDGAVGHVGSGARKPDTGAATTGATAHASASDAADPLGPHPGVDLMLAALSLRPNDDPPVSPDERRELRHIAASARLGAVERALHAGEIDDGVPAALEALRTGGDVFAVRLGGTRDTAKTVAPAIGPGGGAAAVVSLDGRSTPLVNASMTVLRGAEIQGVPVRLVNVEPRWLPTPREEPSLQETRVLLGPAVAVLVEPVARPAPAADALGPSGYLERSVVRDALSLAFTPRARACYLSRTGATPADHKLTGRVRLALDLVRGEVGGARIESSTLGHPVIESCLREAAFALEVPRAYRNDEPVTAVLNLVFRPHTPERPSTTQDPQISREIDLLVEGALKTPEPAPGATAPPALTGRDGGAD